MWAGVACMVATAWVPWVMRRRGLWLERVWKLVDANRAAAEHHLHQITIITNECVGRN